jgi:hypothetical protein
VKSLLPHHLFSFVKKTQKTPKKELDIANERLRELKMKDNGSWHGKLRAKALKNPEMLAEYKQFKLEFELAEQLKTMRQKMKISQETVAESMHSSKSFGVTKSLGVILH